MQIREVLGTALKYFAKRDEAVIAAKVSNRMSPATNDAEISNKQFELCQ
jgi:aryl-alcohol dehydrogenase-like predicted oxidoreductase